MKKIFLLLLSFALLGNTVSLPAFAEESPAVNILLSSCNSADGWTTESSKGTLTLSDEGIDGTKSVQIDCEGEMFFFHILQNGAVDFTNVTHLDFWFYTEDTRIFKYGDCGINLSYTDAWASGGVGVSAATLKALTLQEGWNHITVPLDFSGQTPECDLSKITRFRFYAVKLSSGTRTLRIDNIRAANQEGLDYADETIAGNTVKLIKEIGTVNTYSEVSIKKARASYDLLTDEQKEYVNNYSKLVKAEEAFAQLDTTTVTIPDDMKEKSAPETSELIYNISACDDSSVLTVQGANNVNFVSSGDDKFAVFCGKGWSSPTEIKSPLLNKTPAEINDLTLEDLALSVQLYVSNPAAILSNGQLELTSGGGPDVRELHWKTSALDLKKGWNTLHLDFADGYNTGGFDLTNINYMRLYFFFSEDTVMAVDNIKIVLCSPPQLNENFSAKDSIDNWSAENATIKLNNSALLISGSNDISLSTDSYDLSIIHPERTPVEFSLAPADAEKVESLEISLFDATGKKATMPLDTSILKSGSAAYYMAVPADMTADSGFNFKTTQKLTISASLSSQTTLTLDNVSCTLRRGQYWRDWLYNYEPMDGDYSILVIPDIQELTAVHPQKLDAILQWAADNKEKENIQFAIDLGDITWNGHRGTTTNEAATEFSRAAKAFEILEEAGIDYSICYGNHDYSSGRNTDMFNQYFPYSKYSEWDTFGGAKVEGKMDNVYYTFKVANVKYLVMALEMSPTAETIEWANQVAEDHPDHNIIVSTHSYIGSDGKRTSGGVGSGDYLWENLASKHKNIFMVLCGHECLPNDPGSMAFLEDVGENGNTVYQVMANAQDIDAARGGVGTLLMLRFSNDGRTIDFNYFSPIEGYAYKSVNQFSVTLPDGQHITEPYPTGDLDLSGKITATDALLALQAAVRKITLTDDQSVAADVNGDRSVTAGDALLILQKAVGKIDEFTK